MYHLLIQHYPLSTFNNNKIDMKYINIFPKMTKFLFHPNFSLHKLTNLPRYSKLYLQMHQFRQQQIAKDIQNYKQSEKEQANRKLFEFDQFNINIKESLSKFIKNKKQQVDAGDVNPKHYVNKGFQYLGLYYESLQSLVQGKRQVIHDQEFKFQDGETVRQKQQRMENLLRKIVGKNKQSH